MRIRWLRLALADLDAQAEYIAENDPQAARKVVERIEAATRQLADFPAMGRPGRVPNTRELVVSGLPYIVPYRVVGKTVQILRVLHAARRFPSSK
jgi:toxin ParE1/3/4